MSNHRLDNLKERLASIELQLENSTVMGGYEKYTEEEKESMHSERDTLEEEIEEIEKGMGLR